MLSLPLFAVPTPPVTVDSILGEMADLRRLAHRPDPAYTYRQWTSYDRNMATDPYANGDAGQFLRAEGRERVMADAKGPGAMVRLWSANPGGTLRFYFDGEAKPRLVRDMKALLTGKDPLFPEPYAYVATRGCNLYFPMPYAKGLKVTWEGPADAGLYYAVGTRAYTPGTRAVTYVPGAGAARARTMAEHLYNGLPKGDMPPAAKLGLGGFVERRLRRPLGGEIDTISVQVDGADDTSLPWTDPQRLHNRLRALRLRMAFDGETTVDVPLGDFFGATVAQSVFATLPVGVGRDGMMRCYLTMPYRRAARIWITNEGKATTNVRLAVNDKTRLFLPGTYLFHARWHSQTRPTMPRYDFTFLDAKGEGRYVGSALLVSNPAPAWWGEGDEKVSVDGEAFPSLFGTGTEDYFGYAWSDPMPFARPYHAQPKTPNVGNLGQTENLRWHIVDDIPFTKGIRFDMEAWHWADVVGTYATTAYWYALPGGTLPEAYEAVPVPEVALPRPVAGAIEGEGLRWETTDGIGEVQDGFAQLSGLKQFWWRGSKVHSTATATIPVPAAGRYELFANLGHARDYGRFRVTVNGAVTKEVDLYRPELEWRRESLGTFDLPAGGATVRFEALDANPKSVPGANMLGVDYFLLEKAQP